MTEPADEVRSQARRCTADSAEDASPIRASSRSRGSPSSSSGDPAVFTREEAAAAAGLTVEQARPYWRAMGFADVGTAPAFTSTDVESLCLLTGWVTSGTLDEATTIEVVRSLGQTASRLADWQVDTMARVLSESEAPVDLAAVGEGMAEVMPGLESLLVHAWRRHLAAAIGRGLAFVADDPEAVAGADAGHRGLRRHRRLHPADPGDGRRGPRADGAGLRVRCGGHRRRARRPAGQDPGRRGDVRLRPVPTTRWPSPRRCTG